MPSVVELPGAIFLCCERAEFAGMQDTGVATSNEFTTEGTEGHGDLKIPTLWSFVPSVVEFPGALFPCCEVAEFVGMKNSGMTTSEWITTGGTEGHGDLES